MELAIAPRAGEAQKPPKIVDYGPQLNITIWSLTGLAAVFLGLRIYCKIWRNRSIWWDDYILIMSWIALAISTSLQSMSVSIGFGRHNADINQDKFSQLLLISNAAGFATILAAVWSKTSFAVTLLRITDGWTRRFVWFVIVTINLTLATTATIQWAQCKPIERIWITTMEGECLPRIVLIQVNTYAAAYSGACDIILALLPWKIIWYVAIDKKEKIGALFAMSMGVFAGITSILKINTISAIASDDIIYSVNLLIFGTAEGAITIMAASIPILRALLQRYRRPPQPRLNQDILVSVDLPPIQDDAAAEHGDEKLPPSTAREFA